MFCNFHAVGWLSPIVSYELHLTRYPTPNGCQCSLVNPNFRFNKNLDWQARNRILLTNCALGLTRSRIYLFPKCFSPRHSCFGRLHFENTATPWTQFDRFWEFRAETEKSAGHRVLRDCILKIPPHFKRGVTVFGNSCMGIEKYAGVSVLRGRVLKTPPHLKHRVTVFGNFLRGELKNQPVVAFYETAF